MRLFEGDINRRPLTDRDGSGVSALLELDGFVVRAQLLDEDTGDWWLAVERVQGRGGARPAVSASGRPLPGQGPRRHSTSLPPLSSSQTRAPLPIISRATLIPAGPVPTMQTSTSTC